MRLGTDAKLTTVLHGRQWTPQRTPRAPIRTCTAVHDVCSLYVEPTLLETNCKSRWMTSTRTLDGNFERTDAYIQNARLIAPSVLAVSVLGAMLSLCLRTASPVIEGERRGTTNSSSHCLHTCTYHWRHRRPPAAEMEAALATPWHMASTITHYCSSCELCCHCCMCRRCCRSRGGRRWRTTMIARQRARYPRSS